MNVPFLLLAEDDDDDRFLFSQALSIAEPNVVCSMVSNGKEVITLLENDFLSLPDYIMLDLNMPLMNGWECLKAIRKVTGFSTCTVVIYSTAMEPELESKLLADGAFACFIKPSGIYELVLILTQLFSQHPHK